ncbi:MAG TPA: DoxX family protein [Mesorhizobium sp.]
MQMTFLQPWAPHIRSILRILAAATFLTHGTMKLFGWPVPMGDGPLDTMMLVAGILELVGGLLLLIGLFSRPVAFLLAGMMAVAYFLAHAPQGFFPALNGGEAALLFCWVFLYIAAAGPGPISVDAQLGND